MNPRHRLGGRHRIARVRSEGVVVRMNGFRARSLPGEQGTTRVAIAVVRARSAVERNRARRRVRAALAGDALSLGAADVVMSVPAEAATLRFEELRRIATATLRRAAGGPAS